MTTEKKTATVYEYKGQRYRYVFTGKMKIGQVWVMCIVYKSYKDGRIYIRERGDFNEKFKPANLTSSPGVSPE